MSADDTIAEILKPVAKEQAAIAKLEKQIAQLAKREGELNQQIAETLASGKDASALQDERRDLPAQRQDLMEALKIAAARLDETRATVAAEAADRRILQIKRLAGSLDEARRRAEDTVEELERQLAEAKAKVQQRDAEIGILHAESLVLAERFGMEVPSLPATTKRFPPRLLGRSYREVRPILSMTRETPTASILEAAGGWPDMSDEKTWKVASTQHMVRSREREHERRVERHAAATDWLRALLRDGPVLKSFVYESAAAAVTSGDLTLDHGHQIQDIARQMDVVEVCALDKDERRNREVDVRDKPVMWALRGNYDKDAFIMRRVLHDAAKRWDQQILAEMAMVSDKNLLGV